MSPLISAKKELLSATRTNLSGFSMKRSHGPRSVADRIESYVSEIARGRFGAAHSPARSTRSTEDFSLRFGPDTVYVDVKTHFVQGVSGFSMPNLVSVVKLRAILEAPSLSLLYVFVDYSRSPRGSVSIEKVKAAYVWELDWSMLRIGSLGLGQLQISNANKKLSFSPNSRTDFLLKLRSEAFRFYATQEKKMRRERGKWG